MAAHGAPRLFVLASTYPRWRDDPEPGFVHELSRRLAKHFEVTVLAPHAPGAATRERLDGVDVRRYRYAPLRWETLVNDGGIVENLRRSPWKVLLLPGFVGLQWWHAWRLCRHARIDVIHAHWLLPQGLVAALLPGRTSFVVTSHGADLFALKGRGFDALKRFVVKRSIAATVVSEAMRERLLALGAVADGVSVLPMGVELSARFTPDEHVPRSADELLFVGRLVEKKGLRHLLEAMPAILDARPDARLTVAGFGPDLGALQAQVARLGLGDRVSFVGAVSQAGLPALYRRAALFVAPFVTATGGDQEGLGLVTIEALCCGCPVVVSALPAVLDVLDPVEDARMLVPPGDPSALAKQVIAALADPAMAREGAERARRKLLPRFDWDVVSAHYARLLTRASAGKVK